MHNLFLVYFVNLYMFRAYLDPSSGGTTVCIEQLVLIILSRWLSFVQVGLDKKQSSERIISTNFYVHTVVPLDDGPGHFLDDRLLSWLDWTTNSHLKRIISANFYIHKFVPTDDGPGYGRNMCRSTKYTQNKLCIKLDFLYTITCII